MNTVILKQMQTQGYLLRETIQKKTKRKFGVHLVTARGLSIHPVSYANLPKWLELDYIKFIRTKEIPAAKDLQHRFYTLGQDYVFDLEDFGLDIQTLQVNWKNWWDNPHAHLLSHQDWDTFGELLLRHPPAYSLDEVILLNRFTTPVGELSIKQQIWFEQWVSEMLLFSPREREDRFTRTHLQYCLEEFTNLEYTVWEKIAWAYLRQATIREGIRQRR